MRTAIMLRILALLLVLPGAALAHELWVEPTDYTVAPDAMVQARIFNGQSFGGNEVALFPPRIASFTLYLGDEAAEVAGRAGDSPALNMAPLGEGLHIAAYVSSGDLLTYDSYGQFARFVEHKDFAGWVHHQHRDRGLSEDGIKEYYTRYSKALIAVGDGAGQDRALGLETELVALANPFTDDVTGGLPVLALYQGQPRVDAQIELFDKAPDGTVVTTYYRTDAQGQALLPVVAGHSYLVDAVVLRVPSDALAADKGAMWESLWAALTFAVP
jgi:hypothetical protein